MKKNEAIYPRVVPWPRLPASSWLARMRIVDPELVCANSDIVGIRFRMIFRPSDFFRID